MSSLPIFTKESPSYPHIFVHGQCVTLRESFTFAGRHLRIEITTDSVKSQGRAVVELFDGNTWNVLCSIHPYQMRTDPQLAYIKTPAPSRKNFQQDHLYLIQEAVRLLTAP